MEAMTLVSGAMRQTIGERPHETHRRSIERPNRYPAVGAHAKACTRRPIDQDRAGLVGSVFPLRSR